MASFAFYRFRFHFQAVDPVRFPPGGSANAVRGAWGILLRQTAPPDIYRRLFEPGNRGHGPSGLAEWPRPYVFRTAHLDGVTVAPGDPFFFDAHVFDLQEPSLPHFRRAFAEWVRTGIGVWRGRATLERIEQLALDDRARAIQDELDDPCVVGLDAETVHVGAVTVRFATPTELKARGAVTDGPEFGVLFGRLRDRISTLRALYGQGALALDFRGMGERAAAVTLQRCDLTWQRATRTSSRTGETHPLGGFVGEAEYHGVLAEFVPWLRAARWTGVGRHAVWGHGDVRVLREYVANEQ